MPSTDNFFFIIIDRYTYFIVIYNYLNARSAHYQYQMENFDHEQDIHNFVTLKIFTSGTKETFLFIRPCYTQELIF